MPFLTESQVLARARSINERLVKSAATLDGAKNVFVSYAQVDADLIRGAIALLADYGGQPYVDGFDPAIRTMTVPTEKAAHLRETIKRCGRLVLILTDQSMKSNWTPWEVGLADGMHGREHVATLPITKLSGTDDFGLREFLGRYPQVYEGELKGDSKTSLLVRDPADHLSWRLHNWLSLPRSE